MEAERVIIIAGKVANHALKNEMTKGPFALRDERSFCLEERKVVLMAPA